MGLGPQPSIPLVASHLLIYSCTIDLKNNFIIIRERETGDRELLERERDERERAREREEVTSHLSLSLSRARALKSEPRYSLSRARALSLHLSDRRPSRSLQSPSLSPPSSYPPTHPLTLGKTPPLSLRAKSLGEKKQAVVSRKQASPQGVETST